MARPKKDGKRATGIQGKKGFLYVVISQKVLRNGSHSIEKKWISTGLPDTPDNVKKASEIRMRLKNSNKENLIDRNITVSDYIDHILAKKEREIANTTYSSYLYQSNRIKKYFGDMKLKDLCGNMVEGFLDDLFISHNLQSRSVKDTKVLFGSIVAQAVKDGIIPYNPVKEVRINKNLAAEYARERNKDDEFFSYDEAQAFINSVESHELYELFYITLFFGLRREEVLGLKWSCIDLDQKTMTISHTVTVGTTVNRTNSTKTHASRRTYPLNDEQVDMFSCMKKKERANRKLCGNGYKDSDYVFKHVDGTLYYPDYPSKTFKKLIKTLPSLPQGITFHGLRSSCVSILVHQGMDVKSIQKWVGHADIDTTLRIYAKVKEKEAKKEISSSMNSVFKARKYSQNN